jgi:hypothetical protein
MSTHFSLFTKLVLLLSAIVFMVGCALDGGGYPQAQSLEAAVQGVLAKEGYYQGPIDGTVGPSTSQAIRNYQRDHKLTPTGTINPALTTSMGLSTPEYTTTIYPTYTYPAYVPWYAGPRYYTQPAVIGVGWQNCQPHRGRYNNYGPPYGGFHHGYNEGRRCW